MIIFYLYTRVLEPYAVKPACTVLRGVS